LSPETEKPPGEVLILNHSWWDRPEDMLSELKIDQVYADMLAKGMS
jgi:hypothetical protein